MIVRLLSKSSTGKFRGVIMQWVEEWNEEENGFVIYRESYQYKGKRTVQPNIVITKGKAGRSHREQAILEFNSNKKKYLDKGYKEVEKDIDEYTEDELNEIYGDVKTDANGFAKHMLAKSADKVSESTINKVKYWYASRKIDGCRAALFFKDGEIHSASRGGGDYDPSTIHLRQHPVLISYFNNHPNIILDLELYKHGKSLQQISGAARLEKNAYDCDWLEAYVYDVMIPNMKFEDRLQILNQISKELNLGFDPEREWNEGELQMQMVPHIKVSGYDNIMKLHNDYVSEGWEGVVCRNPEKEYGFGKRSNDMLKFKMYKDSTVKIVDKEAGLRGSEDMVFICEMKNGIQFKAKPFGTREEKENYWNNFDELCKNQIGELKYFYLSDEGTPLQPSLKCIRYDITEPEL